MDRGAWQVTVHMVAESDMTDLLLLAYSKGGNNLLDGNLNHFASLNFQWQYCDTVKILP